MPGLASDPFGQWLLVVQHELESDSQITAIMLLRSTKWYGDPVEPAVLISNSMVAGGEGKDCWMGRSAGVWAILTT